MIVDENLMWQGRTITLNRSFQDQRRTTVDGNLESSVRLDNLCACDATHIGLKKKRKNGNFLLVV